MHSNRNSKLNLPFKSADGEKAMSGLEFGRFTSSPISDVVKITDPFRSNTSAQLKAVALQKPNHKTTFTLGNRKRVKTTTSYHTMCIAVTKYKGSTQTNKLTCMDRREKCVSHLKSYLFPPIQFHIVDELS